MMHSQWWVQQKRQDVVHFAIWEGRVLTQSYAISGPERYIRSNCIFLSLSALFLRKFPIIEIDVIARIDVIHYHFAANLYRKSQIFIFDLLKLPVEVLERIRIGSISLLFTAIKAFTVLSLLHLLENGRYDILLILLVPDLGNCGYFLPALYLLLDV